MLGEFILVIYFQRERNRISMNLSFAQRKWNTKINYGILCGRKSTDRKKLPAEKFLPPWRFKALLVEKSVLGIPCMSIRILQSAQDYSKSLLLIHVNIWRDHT